MHSLVRRVPWPGAGSVEPESLLEREWLVTNGLGGYASGTVSGIVTRRYHGLLIAGLPAPLGRTVMLNHLSEQVRLPNGTCLFIGGAERVDKSLECTGAVVLTEFRLEAGLPCWRYKAGDLVLEKNLLLPYRQNTVHVTYRLLCGAGPVQLQLSPHIQFRPHEAPVDVQPAGSYMLTVIADQYEVSLPNSPLPPLRLLLYGQEATYTIDRRKIERIFYRAEAQRGYEATGDLWSPGYFAVNLAPGNGATLVAATESWETIRALPPADALAAERERRVRVLALAPPQAQAGMAAELVLAADQFIVAPAGRVQDTARAYAAGDEVRTVIAGYHWFTDWGRDTMISLEGLTLATGRHTEAGWILRTFADSIRDGLLPNLFPEGGREGLYHTADATLWFFHAIACYLACTDDRATLRLLLPKLLDIVAHHLHGTRFGIGVDAHDGLLRQGQEGYQLTWMDAKVGDWVVTPRRGKAVEINALWYNALRFLEQWVREEHGGEAARPLAEHAERVYRSFNTRFWYAPGGYLYDAGTTRPAGPTKYWPSPFPRRFWTRRAGSRSWRSCASAC